MKKPISSDEWVKEFQEFMAVEVAEPPRQLSQQIVSRIHSELNPSPVKVFLKLSLVHALVGAVTLLFCPQFGIGFLGGMGLMGIFMKWGVEACTLSCGAVFMSVSLGVASWVLKAEEVQVIRKARILQIGALGLISLGFFICVAPEIVYGLTAFWLGGSLIGGLAGLEAVWAVKNWVSSHRMSY